MDKEQKTTLIQKAFLILKEKGYSQINVVKKLQQLNFLTNKSTFNKIINDKEVSHSGLIIVFEGIKVLLENELCLALSKDLEWATIEGQQPNIIPIKSNNHQDFIFHPEGRLDIADKVSFLSSATKEIIEFGTTLNSFSGYFENRRESEFKLPIKTLLEKGVHLKCFLLDPDWNGTRFYFEDHASSVHEGLPGIEKIRASLRKLKAVHQEFTAAHLMGKFEVFTYRHFPHNYFLVIDKADSRHAKMMVSNYLHGQKRADCPVIEFTRTDQPILFRRYADSLEQLMKKAKKMDFSKIVD